MPSRRPRAPSRPQRSHQSPSVPPHGSPRLGSHTPSPRPREDRTPPRAMERAVRRQPGTERATRGRQRLGEAGHGGALLLLLHERTRHWPLSLQLPVGGGHWPRDVAMRRGGTRRACASPHLRCRAGAPGGLTGLRRTVPDPRPAASAGPVTMGLLAPGPRPPRSTWSLYAPARRDGGCRGAGPLAGGSGATGSSPGNGSGWCRAAC